MQPLRVKKKKGPEWYIQQDIIKELRFLGWFVKPTHGSMYQSGFPDLYCCHTKYGARWIEVKNVESYRFTSAQLDVFPKISAHGAGIWVLTSADESELNKIHGPANWHTYLKW